MKTDTKTVISINDISKVYEGPPPVKALDGVSLNVKEGDLVAIVGQSGSGKSTLLNMIGLLDSVTDGSIEIEGKDISDLTDNELSKFRGEKIGFIFQSFFLLPGLTAQENVAEGLLYQGISRSERLEKAGDVLEQVGLGDRLSHLPKELSGGQQQRVAIARALVQDPAFVLADEPTGNLDKESGINILNILKELNDQGKTVIMITHNQEHANMFKKVIELKMKRKKLRTRDLFFVALYGVRARKGRATLTSIGIGIGWNKSGKSFSSSRIFWNSRRFTKRSPRNG